MREFRQGMADADRYYSTLKDTGERDVLEL
jgi:hypothetical protein